MRVSSLFFVQLNPKKRWNPYSRSPGSSAYSGYLGQPEASPFFLLRGILYPPPHPPLIKKKTEQLPHRVLPKLRGFIPPKRNSPVCYFAHQKALFPPAPHPPPNKKIHLPRFLLFFGSGRLGRSCPRQRRRFASARRAGSQSAHLQAHNCRKGVTRTNFGRLDRERKSREGLVCGFFFQPPASAVESLHKHRIFMFVMNCMLISGALSSWKESTRARRRCAKITVYALQVWVLVSKTGCGVQLHRSRLEFGVAQVNRVLGPWKQPRLLGLGFWKSSRVSAIQSEFRASSEQ